MLTLRGFNEDDPQLILRLKEQAGWNQTPADLDRFQMLAPEGIFVAEWDGQSAGCVIAFEFEAVAWIAMMLVDESFRGRGIGRALMDCALEHLDSRGIPTVRLDATPLGEPLYRKLGFAPQFEVRRFAGSPKCEDPDSIASGTKGALLPAVEEQVEEILDLDREVTQTDRRKLLLALFEEQPDELRVVIHDRRVIGYMTTRPGATARQVGPSIADASCGPRLLADALSRHAGQACFVDIPRDNAAASAIAEACGMAVQRSVARMCRGVPVLEDLDRFVASSSPEKG